MPNAPLPLPQSSFPPVARPKQPMEDELRQLGARNPNIAAAITLFDVGCANWAEAMSLVVLQFSGAPLQSDWASDSSCETEPFTYEKLTALMRERTVRSDADSALIRRLAEELLQARTRHSELLKACAPLIETIAREKTNSTARPN